MTKPRPYTRIIIYTDLRRTGLDGAAPFVSCRTQRLVTGGCHSLAVSEIKKPRGHPLLSRSHPFQAGDRGPVSQRTRVFGEEGCAAFPL